MRVAALDLIRFIAALSVVFYHYITDPLFQSLSLFKPIAEFMYLGVPLFFMISGYVIAISANNRTAVEFGVARFWRLYPTLWVSVLFTVGIILLYTDRTYTVWEVLANFTLVNEYLSQPNVDEVYWTLKAELRFYGCIFLLLLFGVFDKFKTWLTVWVAVTCAHLVFKQPFFMGWFISPNYSSFFIAGVVLYLIGKQGLTRFNLVLLGASLIISSIKTYQLMPGFVYNPSEAQQYAAVLIIWMFYLLMYLLCANKIRVRPSKFIATLGALTFPLYLIHNAAGKTIIDHYSQVYPESLVIMLTIVIMLLSSWIINYIVNGVFSNHLKLRLLNIFQREKRSLDAAS